MPAFIVPGSLLMSQSISALNHHRHRAGIVSEDGLLHHGPSSGPQLFPAFWPVAGKTHIQHRGKSPSRVRLLKSTVTAPKNIISLIMIYALLLVNVGNYVQQQQPFLPY